MDGAQPSIKKIREVKRHITVAEQTEGGPPEGKTSFSSTSQSSSVTVTNLDEKLIYNIGFSKEASNVLEVDDSKF
ncbi:UNVERIFIED_CONTAM: hypothetical protein NCL1_16601 [Trichonephila clavipes]